MKYIEFQYRDGGNYKWNFTISITDDKFKELGEIKSQDGDNEGTELNYDTDLGITQDEFHEQRGYPYDDAIDHNIVEVLKIMDELPENESTSFDIK